MSEQVPYREPGTAQAGRIGGRGGVILGAIVLAVGACSIALPRFVALGEFQGLPLVIGFGLVCLGVSFILNGAIDWMRGR
jgi:hypothetical protein